jgi:hypothetical protein
MARRDPWLFLGLLAFFGLVFLALFALSKTPLDFYLAPRCAAAIA